MSQPIILHGQRIGKLRASWLLFKESWRFFRVDPELFWIPIIFGLLNILIVLVLIGGAVVALVGYESVVSVDIEEVPAIAVYGFLFLTYVAAAFSYALSQASVVHTVSSRVHGGNASLRESVKIAFSYSLRLFVWSLVTSTVGIILHIISERSKVLVKVVTGLLGATWSVLTYFVVPSMILANKSALPAITHSTTVFKSTWGETFVSNISLRLTFLLAHLVAFLVFVGSMVFAVIFDVTALYVASFIVYIVCVFIIVLIHEVLHAVLKTLLYIYATNDTVSVNFDKELLSSMLARTTKNTYTSPVTTTSAI